MCGYIDLFAVLCFKLHGFKKIFRGRKNLLKQTLCHVNLIERRSIKGSKILIFSLCMLVRFPTTMCQANATFLFFNLYYILEEGKRKKKNSRAKLVFSDSKLFEILFLLHYN